MSCRDYGAWQLIKFTSWLRDSYRDKELVWRIHLLSEPFLELSLSRASTSSINNIFKSIFL